MPVSDRHRAAEARFRSLLEEADLSPPDRVEYDAEELIFFWDEPKLAVIVELA